MTELLLVLVLSAIGAVERMHASAKWSAEREQALQRYLRLLEVSTPAEVRAAKPRTPKTPSGPEQVRPVAEGL